MPVENGEGEEADCSSVSPESALGWDLFTDCRGGEDWDGIGCWLSRAMMGPSIDQHLLLASSVRFRG